MIMSHRSIGRACPALFASFLVALPYGVPAPAVAGNGGDSGGGPKIFFAGPGTVVQATRCIVFETDGGVPLVVAGLDAYPVGTRLWIEGGIDPGCVTAGCAVEGCIDAPEISPLFEGCGVLSIGPQGCLVLVPDDGGVVVAPDDVSSFGPGAHVFVIGKLVEESFACFPVSIAAVEQATTTICLPTFISGCGKLTFGPQGCTIFVDYMSGLGFVLQNNGGFGAGDTLFVEGPVNAELGGCFPILVPVIENTVVERCSTPADLNGDGVVDGADLGILLGQWGDCPFLFFCSADFENDGDVDGADLGVLLGAWSGG